MSLSFNIALRYLRAKKGHTAVNIISIISVLGVVVTTAALICVLSVFNGFHDLIKEKLSTVDPDIAITATMGKTIADADSVVRVAQAIPGVEMVMPGDNIDMEITLITPIALEQGLRFAIREGGRTVGSGVVAKVIE